VADLRSAISRFIASEYPDGTEHPADYSADVLRRAAEGEHVSVAHAGQCSLCVGVLPDGEWCRACGFNAPDKQSTVGRVLDALSTGGLSERRIVAMTGVRLAVRLANGGCLSTDGPDERAAFHAAMVARDGCTCPFPGEAGYVRRDCPVHDPDGTYHDQPESACAACGGTHWTDEEDGGQCINCGLTHPNMTKPDAEGEG